MSMIRTPILEPGERSLPAELRTARGYGFAQRRLAAGMQGVAGWGRGGVSGLGQDDDEGSATSTATGVTSSTTTASTTESPSTSTLIGPTGLPVDSCPENYVAVDNQCQLIPLNTTPTEPATSAQQVANAPAYSTPTGYTGPTSVAAGQTPPCAPAGYQWAQVANSSALSLAKVLAVSQGGTVLQLPNGEQVISGGASSLATGAFGTLTGFNLSSILPWLLLIGGGVFVLSLVEKR